MSYTIPDSTAITRFRGDTEAITFQLVDTAGAALDITGYSFLLTISPTRSPVDSSAQVAQQPGSLTDAANGVVTFAVPDPGAGSIDPGSYYWDAQYVTGASEVRTFARGTWKVVQDITKEP
tara:strand:- start:4874 stop:5236 length:363 start_codon:yes stop_codon:yes gene_type:complete